MTIRVINAGLLCIRGGTGQARQHESKNDERAERLARTSDHGRYYWG